MSAGAIVNLSAFVTIGAALILLACFSTGKDNLFSFGALALGAIAGVALTVSGFMLMDGWAAQMEQFDFAGFEPTMNAGRPGLGGTIFAIYSWPYLSVVLGALATYAFGRQLRYDIQTRTR